MTNLLSLLFVLFNLFISTKNDQLIIDNAKLIHKNYKSNKQYVVMIDYSKSIDEERLFLVDVVNSKIVLKSRVSHAWNSGRQFAFDFSNTPNTKKSSLGVYKTSTTYYGRFGYSLKVKGLEERNSNAESRSIIFHSNKLMKTKWSWGCFATPEETNTKLIDLIKGGCLVYVFTKPKIYICK